MIAVAVGFRLVARSVLGALLLFAATAAVAVVRDAQENFFDGAYGKTSFTRYKLERRKAVH